MSKIRFFSLAAYEIIKGKERMSDYYVEQRKAVFIGRYKEMA